MRIAFAGLGAMGRPMAANLARSFDTLVWNRTSRIAEEHAEVHGSTAVLGLVDLASADVVCTCLPTTREVTAVAGSLAPVLDEGTIWIDHTSGDPAGSRDLAARLSELGITYLDAPVSGGTDGAAAGSLTVMVGGEEEALDAVRPALNVVADRVVHVGPVGAGMAVKAVNQGLLAAGLWAAGEGLTALKAAGVSTVTALEVLNDATGRSFVTERLLPDHAVTRAFPMTFALSLFAKDVGLATSVVEEAGLEAPLLHLVDRLTADASERLGPQAGHVELVKLLEEAAGTELS